VQRVFVPHLIAQDIAQQIANQASLLIVDNAIKEETACGPLIRPREVDRVASWIEEAKSEGAQIICGGTRLSKTCYEPTVLLNPHTNSKVSRQEIFGPAICVYSYEKIEEVFDMANSLPFAFQSSVFTNNFDFAFQAVKALDASAVMINEHTAFRTDWMPFAGRRQSGYGVGGIPYTMRDFTQDKMVVMSF
jgi:acyl-CoA reductase-like NAD-dependent aldehyde dehydrogenase